MSGVLYRQAGVTASPWGAVVFAGLAGIGAMFLPPVTADVEWSGAKGDDWREVIMTGLTILIVVALVAIVVALWRINRPPPQPPVS